MKYAKASGLAVVIVVALGALLSSSAWAAEEFITNKTGTLKGKALSIQEFKAGTGATVECSKLTASGTVSAVETTEQQINSKYESCSVLVFGSASVSEAHYTYFTPLGVSVLEKPIIIKASGFGEECEIEINEPQTVGSGLAKSGKMEIEYANKPGTIDIEEEIEKIKSKILKSTSVSDCGKVGESSSTGVYVGDIEIELEGGGIAVAEKGGPRWWTEVTENGQKLFALLFKGETQKVLATGGAATLEVPTEGVAIMCKKTKMTGGEIIGGSPGADQARFLTLEECTMEKPKESCSLVANSISFTEPHIEIPSTLGYFNKNVNEIGDLIGNSEFEGSWEIVGTPCSKPGKFVASGTIIATITPHAGGALKFTFATAAGKQTPSQIEIWNPVTQSYGVHTAALALANGKEVTLSNALSVSLESKVNFEVK